MESQSPLHVVRVRESFVEELLNFYTDLRICQKRIISLKMSWERLRWCCGGDVSGVHCLECSYYTSLPRFLLFLYFSFLALKLGSFFSMFFVCGGKLEVWTFFLLPNIKIPFVYWSVAGSMKRLLTLLPWSRPYLTFSWFHLIFSWCPFHIWTPPQSSQKIHACFKDLCL